MLTSEVEVEPVEVIEVRKVGLDYVTYQKVTLHFEYNLMSDCGSN
jgi:hypothetical protein